MSFCNSLNFFSEFEPRQKLNQSQISFDNLMGYILSISIFYAKVYQNIPFSSRDKGHFHFFKIWCSARPRPMINVILQFLELDLVNINVSAKFYQNIPNGFRVKFHFFS